MSIRDIAKAVGVAPSTVSLVLNGGDRVSEETVRLVQRELKRQNYRPGRPGRPPKRPGAPRTRKRSNRIALLAWGMPIARLHTPVYMSVVQGIEQAVNAAGKTFVLRHVLPDQVAAGPSLHASVDGAIIFGQQESDELALEMAGVPCVQVMGPILRQDRRCDHITYDDRQVGVLAADYLLAREHHRLALIGHHDTASDSTRGKAFLERIQQAGLAATDHWRDPLFQETSDVQQIHRENLIDLVDEMLALSPQPTGLFVHADAITQSLYPILQERGMCPGQDIEVVSCNNETLLLNGLNPRPATVDIHCSEIGRRAVEQLLRRIEHPNASRVLLALEPELVTAPCPGAPR